MQANVAHRLLPLVLGAFLLHGCGQLQERPSPVTSDLARAEALAGEGQYLAAADLYRQIALRTDDPTAQAALLLAGGEAAAAGGDWDAARNAVAELAQRPLTGTAALRYRLLMAEVLLTEMRPLDALEALGEPPAAADPIALQLRFYEDSARAYRQMGNLFESAKVLQALDPLLRDRQRRLDNQTTILRTLALLNEQLLEKLQPSPPGIEGGWMQLALIVKQHGSEPEKIAPLFEDWRRRFPQHPAMPELLLNYADQIQAQLSQFDRIAVLLPQSGKLAEVSSAIRDGLLIQRLRTQSPARPALRFYDSSDSATVWPLYNQAVADGAQLVIGPLQKDAVNQLLRAGELPVPVLALNEVTLSGAPPINLFMYSLSPEDEARQVAERIWIDGMRRPAVLAPQGDWGDRLATAFEQRWQGLGGDIAGVGRYDSGAHDYSGAITGLLHLDQSAARHKELQQWLGKQLEFEPRRREDIDAVFVAARPVQAQGIRPQLQFHRAGDLPVYATSDAWLGQLSRSQAEDMRGILLPEIPWMIHSEGADDDRAVISRYLPRSGAAYGRLYAMGMDAFQLAPNLNRLSSSRFESLDGKTGNLFMDEGRRIRRQLVWLRLDDPPEVLGFAPRLDLQEAPVEVAPAPSPVVETAPAS
jgi:hypothetical protein